MRSGKATCEPPKIEMATFWITMVTPIVLISGARGYLLLTGRTAR